MVRAQAKECIILGRPILDPRTDIKLEYRCIILIKLSLLRCVKPFDRLEIQTAPSLLLFSSRLYEMASIL